MAYFARIRAGSVLFTRNTVTAAPGSSIGQAIQLVCESNNNGPECTSARGYPVDYEYAQGCAGATDGCCDKVQESYIWNNTLTRVGDELTVYSVCGDGAIAEGTDYFRRAPTQADDGFTWTPYPYPHPLVQGLSVQCASLGGVACCTVSATCPGVDLGPASGCDGICCSTASTKPDGGVPTPDTGPTTPDGAVASEAGPAGSDGSSGQVDPGADGCGCRLEGSEMSRATSRPGLFLLVGMLLCRIRKTAA
jgi:hypothetical protein